MHQHLFELQKGSKKDICPNCGKKTFVRYVNTETGEHLPDHYGRCDREIKCGHHQKPDKDVYTKGKKGKYKTSRKGEPIQAVTESISFIPDAIVKKHLRHYNTFATFLKNLIGKEQAERILLRYGTGTYQGENRYYENAIVYWQIDTDGRVRAGKIMAYNPNTGKRAKNSKVIAIMNWVHSVEPELKDRFDLNQCLFGEHLLNQPENDGKPVCIVESEKTVIIASFYFPQYLWLATGGLQNLKAEKLEACKGRKIILIPDLKATEIWSAKAGGIYGDVHVFDGLELIATDAERADGWDLADFLINDPARITHFKFEGKSKEKDTSVISWQSDDKELQVVRNANKTFINQSPTGTGKTRGAIEYAQAVRAENDKTLFLFGFHVRILAKQTEKSYDLPCVIGGEHMTESDLFDLIQNEGILAATWEKLVDLGKKGYFQRLINAGYEIRFTIDEAHELEGQDSIRPDAIDYIVNELHKYGTVELMTGTVSLTLPLSLNAPVYKSPCLSQIKADFKALTFDGKKEKWYDALTWHLISNDGTKTDVVRINNIDDIAEYKVRVIENGYYKAGEIAVIQGKRGELFASDEVSERTLKSITENERIPDDVKLVLCTSVMDTGVNIRNTNLRIFAVHSGYVGFEAYNIRQFFSRFREAGTIDFNYIISENCAKREVKPLRDEQDGLYSFNKQYSISEKLELVKADVLNYYSILETKYKDQASVLQGEKAVEYFKRTADLTNEVPKFRYDMDAQSFKIRTTHIGNECKKRFQKSLSLDTLVRYLSDEYQSIAHFSTSKSMIQRTKYDASAKEKEVLEALAVIGQMLQDKKQRYYLYSLCLEHQDLGILNDIKKIDNLFNYQFYKNVIKFSSEFSAWKETNAQILERANFGRRVRQFLTYMIFTANVEFSANWVVQYSDETSYYNQRAKLCFAVFNYLETSGLKADYITDAVMEQERQIKNKVLTMAGELFKGKIKSSALSKQVHEKTLQDDLTNGLSQRQVAHIIRAGYALETVTIKGHEYIKTMRRIELSDLLGEQTGFTIEHLRQVVTPKNRVDKGGYNLDIRKSPPTNPPPIAEQPNNEPVPVQVIARPTVVTTEPTPPADGYYSEFMVKGQLQRRWIDLSVFPKAGR